MKTVSMTALYGGKLVITFQISSFVASTLIITYIVRDIYNRRLIGQYW